MDISNTLPITFLNYTNVTKPAEICHDSYDVIYLLSGRLTISRADELFD